MIRMSKQARQVVEILADNGISLSMEDQFSVEVSCSRFHCTHIQGVVGKCLRGGDVFSKLARAQERGWSYFDRPVRDMLEKRDSAWVRPRPDLGRLMGAWSIDVYSIVVTTLLISDMNKKEAASLLYDVPHLVSDRLDLLGAIQICKSQQAQSVSYLEGVLIREDAKTQARKDTFRTMIESSQPWEPDPEFDLIEHLDRVTEDWKRRQDSIHANIALRDYARSNPRL